MTAPGGDHDEANPTPEQPDGEAPWAPPTDSAPPVSPPPGYSPERSAGYQVRYPGDYPPTPPTAFGEPPYPPAGYGPSPYPGGHYPGPYYPGGYGPPGGPPGSYRPQAAVQPGTHPLAIASLISSFAGVLCFIGSIAGIVLGTIALEQIKRNRQEGYGLAVTGIVIGVAGLVVTLVIVIFAINSR